MKGIYEIYEAAAKEWLETKPGWEGEDGVVTVLVGCLLARDGWTGLSHFAEAILNKDLWKASKRADPLTADWLLEIAEGVNLITVKSLKNTL